MWRARVRMMRGDRYKISPREISTHGRIRSEGPLACRSGKAQHRTGGKEHAGGDGDTAKVRERKALRGARDRARAACDQGDGGPRADACRRRRVRRHSRLQPALHPGRCGGGACGGGHRGLREERRDQGRVLPLHRGNNIPRPGHHNR